MPAPKAKATKPTVAEPELSPLAKASREAALPSALAWSRSLAGMVSNELSTGDATDLLAIGVKMPQHDRDRLLAILLNNA